MEDSKDKQFYEKPAIVRHSTNSVNRFGQFAGSVPHPTIDGVPVKELVEAYGSPLWVVSEGMLRRKYREMHRAFSLRYPRVAIAYSYKTNYLSGICAIFHQEGAWAEVVSGFEYDIATGLKVPGPNIIFNGPHKTPGELARAAQMNSRINVDSYDELHLIEEIGREKNITIPVGVRLNMAVGAPPWDRFGFNLENGQALDACRRVMASSHLRLAGLHVHLGTFITDVNAYRWMAEQVASFCLHLTSEPVVALEYIDIGGGYASHNTLHQQWAPAQYTTPTFDQYAEAVCLALLRGPFRGSDVPLLLVEPGRALVDEAMYLVSSVVSTKMLPSDVKAVVIDAGVNLLPTSVWYRHQIQVVEEAGNLAEGSLLEEVNIYGPLCMQIDAVQFKVSLPPVRRGSLLVIKNVGAYNFSQSMQFIQPRPAVVLVNGGEVEYLRLPETTQYLQQLERVSERLLQRKAEG